MMQHEETTQRKPTLEEHYQKTRQDLDSDNDGGFAVSGLKLVNKDSHALDPTTKGFVPGAAISDAVVPDAGLKPLDYEFPEAIKELPVIEADKLPQAEHERTKQIAEWQAEAAKHSICRSINRVGGELHSFILFKNKGGKLFTGSIIYSEKYRNLSVRPTGDKNALDKNKQYKIPEDLYKSEVIQKRITHDKSEGYTQEMIYPDGSGDNISQNVSDAVIEKAFYSDISIRELGGAIVRYYLNRGLVFHGTKGKGGFDSFLTIEIKTANDEKARTYPPYGATLDFHVATIPPGKNAQFPKIRYVLNPQLNKYNTDDKVLSDLYKAEAEKIHESAYDFNQELIEKIEQMTGNLPLLEAPFAEAIEAEATEI